MEPWRKELYASEVGGYYLMHGRTKGSKTGQGKVYGYRSHTRHHEGQMARSKKENVHGNGRGMEDMSTTDLVRTADRIIANEQSKSNPKKEKSTEEFAKAIAEASRNANSGALTTYNGVEQLVKATKNQKIDLSGYSNKELQDVITRANLESSYIRLAEANSKAEKRREAVNGALTAIGGTLTTAASVLTIALIIKQLRER